jgi:hypothetical protein
MDGKATIIGVSGRKQSGKSTLCEHIRKVYMGTGDSCPEKLGGNICWLLNFADTLKQQVCIDVLGLSNDQVFGSDEDKNSRTEYKWETLPTFIREKYSNEKTEYNVPDDFSFGDESEEIHELVVPRSGYMTSREVMQVVGTDIFRTMLSQDVWVNATLRRCSDMSGIDMCLIGDVRFISEVNAILDDGGYIIRLTRSIDKDTHASEAELDDYSWNKHPNCLIINNQYITEEEKNAIAISWLKERKLLL